MPPSSARRDAGKERDQQALPRLELSHHVLTSTICLELVLSELHAKSKIAHARSPGLPGASQEGASRMTESESKRKDGTAPGCACGGFAVCPLTLEALDAFYLEHRLCGVRLAELRDLEGGAADIGSGRGEAHVWLSCATCDIAAVQPVGDQPTWSQPEAGFRFA